MSTLAKPARNVRAMIGCLGALIGLAGSPALGQGAGTTGPEPTSPPFTPEAMTWTDERAEALATMLTGRWLSTETAAGENASAGRLHVAIVPMGLREQSEGGGITNTLYYELAGVDRLTQPLSSGLLQIIATDSGLYLRRHVLTFSVLPPVLASVWSVPFDFRPKADASWLEAAIDMEIRPAAGGYRATGVAAGPVTGGQIPFDRIEQSIGVTPTRLEVFERLTSFEAGVMLSPQGNFPWTFERIDDVRGTDAGQGVMVFDPVPGDGPVLQQDWFVHVDYTAWPAQSAIPILTSLLPNRSGFTTKVPYSEPGVGLVEGLNVGLPGVREGGRRWIVVPAELGFGDQGSRNVPPGSPLVFAVDAVAVMPPPPPAEEGEAAEGDGEGR